MNKLPLFIMIFMGVLGNGAFAQAMDLQRAIEAALIEQAQLRALQANRQAAEFDVKYRKTGYYPQVNLEAKVAGVYRDDSSIRAMKQEKYFGSEEVSVVLSQNLWDGKNTKYQVESAMYTVDSMDNRVLDMASNLALDTLIAYVDYMRCQMIVQLSVANVAQHEQILASQRKREVLGAATIADVTQIQGRLSRAESALIDARSMEAQARESLASLTALPEASLYEPLVPVSMPLVIPTKEEALAMAQENNFQLQSYMYEAKAAQSDTNVARAAYEPVVDIELAPTYYNTTQKGKNWEAGAEARLVVRWNVFSSGATKAKVNTAEALALEKRENVEAYRIAMEKEISNTLYRYQSAIEQIASYTQAVKYNTQTRNAFQQQFMVGERSLLDVLDTESELYNSSVQLVTMESNKIIAAYRLYALSGSILTLFDISADHLLP